MPKYYPIPEYSRREVNRAGEVLVNPNATTEEKEKALTVINNWRASHNFPLNTFQVRLRRVAKKIHPDNLVAQRIKRLASIKFKLERFPDMNMAQIQDIGGCRAIMRDVSQVDSLVNIYRHESRGMKHKLAKEQDYIAIPKSSGYRGIHLVYKYRSDKAEDYDDMRIEIQVRTLMQHAWATAVETVDTFTKQSLKASQGKPDWLRFFALMSSAMVHPLILSNTPPIENAPRLYFFLLP
jgi:ppGpp synthetase/RelA/SpoT-type nucleotidyltranferase